MELLLAGIEYSGTTTLGAAISAWYTEQTGRDYGFHDHFKFPQISHAVLDADEQQTVLNLSPRLKELLESHQVDYHVQGTFFRDGNHANIGMHLDEAVYGPLYWGYGAPGEPGDRGLLSRKAEDYILKYETSMVLVLLKAEPGVIARRMRENPHENSPLREEDIPLVLERFDEEYEKSRIRHKFSLDTSTATVEETLAEFVRLVEPYLEDRDRHFMALHRARAPA